MKINKGVKVTLLLISIAWLLKILEWSLGVDLYHLGIYPRNRLGTFGILFHPFIHGGFKHLFSNTVSFAILCFSLYFFIPKVATKVLWKLSIYSGILVWIFARPSFHIGASGVIYGIASFLFFIGLFQKNPGSLIISLCIAVLNHGMLVGLVPQEDGISWESHLSGSIVGFFLAYYYRKVETTFSQQKQVEVDEDISYEGYRNLENEHFKYHYHPKDDN
ncbi:rhomboid family intramembrane serine protease [Flammeovirga agarivorans]|uniref:Rhomboid family intramembrane serine protease n=1 Tax=Flammeovirga agarivorans TaxID=2726742 RepID=A0A7X8SN16_9BACT|nr:rhomboid family intramembrane serine protease [Flammeovirga agarivorans]NLR93210.1 rhomboid family intramembrane serine protease [Flammeovirga agarivorans]